MAPIIQWNCRSSRNKEHEILHLISKYSPIVFAVQEMRRKPGDRVRFPGYVCLRDDRSDGYGGSALLISRSVPFSQFVLPSHSENINAVAVKVNNVTFLSVYIPHPNHSCLDEFTRILSSLQAPLMVLGDFNIHHTSWGSYHCDHLSSSFIDICDNYDLCILNDGTPTRRVYPSQNKKSAVDLTLCSPSFSSYVTWTVLPSTHGSDHFPIVVITSNPRFDRAISHNPINCPRPRVIFNTYKADWSIYSSALDQDIEHLPEVTPDNYLSANDSFRNCLLKAAEKCLPAKNMVNANRFSPPWWDSDCTDTCNERKEAELGYAESMTESNFIRYQAVAAKTLRILSEKKKAGWRRFCESLSPTSPPSLVWKNVRRFRGAMSNVNLTSNDPTLWLESFQSKLAPPSAPSETEAILFSLPANSHSEFDYPFSQEELTTALNGLKDSSPGIDGIPYSLIINSSPLAKSYLLSLLNNIFLRGVPPEEWKTQIIIPILKPGKLSNDPNGYRPIALSCTMAKILEHLIKNRLEWIVESRNLLAQSQFGFRKGMSTMDSLSIFITDIWIGLSKNENVTGVFLDVSSAYDNVLLPVLRQKMLDLSIPERLTNIIFNLLSARSRQF